MNLNYSSFIRRRWAKNQHFLKYRFQKQGLLFSVVVFLFPCLSFSQPTRSFTYVPYVFFFFVSEKSFLFPSCFSYELIYALITIMFETDHLLLSYFISSLLSVVGNDFRFQFENVFYHFFYGEKGGKNKKKACCARLEIGRGGLRNKKKYSS